MKIIFLIFTFLVLINSIITVRVRSSSDIANSIQKEEQFFKNSGDSVAYNYDTNDKSTGNNLQSDSTMRTPKIVSKLEIGGYYDDTKSRIPSGI